MPTDIATGSRCTPADSGLYSLKNWKYWVIKKMNPNSEKNETVTEALAALKRRSVNSDTSSIGASLWRSQEMNAASSAIAAAKPPSVAALDQPWPGASMIVNIS